MNASVFERIRLEVHRRLEAEDLVDSTDLEVKLEGNAVLLEGSVDDSFSKWVVESVVREIVAPDTVTSRVSVRDDLGAEAEAKDTEFGTAEAAHLATTSIPRPRG